ncbi:MAG: acyl-CoA dehydrogenase family protein [Gammaproteobacteria bacterium]|nr:acyl-CoA dehydrogenase family protein [Gammaproteobacteria bacterium]
MNLDEFRKTTRDWLDENCPASMRDRAVHFEDAYDVYNTDDARLWLERAAERGWTAPQWPKEYGGGGLSREEGKIFAEEMADTRALPPSAGMGLSMIGPTLLEFGTDAQKQHHLPKITSGEVQWCQGYSEPGSGSDLASLKTKAVLDGDHFVINGQKIWTSGAEHADWMFVLVRTDPAAPKHEGISFLLLDMHQPAITTKPIELISGSSPFCETFFDDALAKKEDLIGELNKGWTVAKRLLQYERSGPGDSGGGIRKSKPPLNPIAKIAKDYLGEIDGRIADPVVRDEVLRHTMMERSLQLTARRVGEENKSTGAPGAATSIFKYLGSTLTKNGSQLKSTLRGTRGLAWDGPFEKDELEATHGWLRDRAVTIYGGTNEVQLNILAQRVLGLPD